MCEINTSVGKAGLGGCLEKGCSIAAEISDLQGGWVGWESREFLR